MSRARLDPREEVDDIANAIVEYLRLHPQAADTIVGIARWWLGPRIGPVTQQGLEQALERLVASREVVCEVLHGGQCVYRRGPGDAVNGAQGI